MVDDILRKREEILRRKEILNKIRIPKVTRRSLQLGIHSKPRRQEIEIYKRKILSRRAMYENQLKKIDKYLKEKEEIRKLGGDDEIITHQPEIFLFPVPKFKEVKKRWRMNWLK